jgi:hypothetical protein
VLVVQVVVVLEEIVKEQQLELLEQPILEEEEGVVQVIMALLEDRALYLLNKQGMALPQTEM